MVADYVNNSIAASEEKQGTEVARRLSDQKTEIERDLEQKNLGRETSFQNYVDNANIGIQAAIRDSAGQTRKEKGDLGMRLEGTMQEMTTGLMKLSEVEQGILPDVKPRLNKMQTDIAELESHRKNIMAKMRNTEDASTEMGPRETEDSKPD